MDIITVLSFTIFVATVVTVVMAAVSYGAFKIREWRKPDDGQAVAAHDARFSPVEEDHFFKKYVLPPEESLERDR
jgi:hypothetical protein